MEPSKRYFEVFVFFLIVPIFFAISLVNDLLHAEADMDQCLSCHTDKNKMKSLIPKFPEPPEEEGEA